jgi:hypothetical protein
MRVFGMQRVKGILMGGAFAALVLSAGPFARAAGHASAAAGPIVAGAWEHHHASLSYYGITALYSCDGLETNIRALLLHLGARKDATVSARGCPRGSSVPSNVAIVDLDFYSLSPGAEANSENSVQARWTPVTVSPIHPYFMANGDCELMEQLKDILSKNFSLRDLSYRTNCVPYQINIDGFGVKAEALKALPAAAASAARN